MVFSFIIISFIALCVEASTFGVSPAGYDVDFEPGLEENFVFDFYTDNPSSVLEVYSREEFTEYVTFDPKKLEGGKGRVNAFLKLPQELKEPGTHRLLIGAKPIISSRGEGGVGIVASVNGAIRVHIPYPGKYAEISNFDVKDANAGEPIRYRLKIHSRGEESITTNSRIEVFDSKNESVRAYQLGTDEIPGVDFVEIKDTFDTTGFGAGDYKAVAIVSYSGREVKKEDIFRLGELNVKIVNYTRMLEKEKINPFVIEVESLWNDPIKELYAEVFVVGINMSFLTPSVELKPWRKERLQGFFDTTGIEEEGFQIRMVIHYGDQTTEETAIMSFAKSRNNYLLIAGIVLGAVGVLAFVVWVIMKFKRLERKGGKGKK